MGSQEDAKTRVARTYNAASDHFDDPANSFWERFGRRTVERLDLNPGSRVLDVCCGSGASAIPAAEAVGANGFVLGVDLAEKLLQLARSKTVRRGLTNIEFRHGDILNLGQPDFHFEAVICVFGIFFVPEMQVAVRELWRRVAPGGKLAITTWGPRFFEPASTAFWNSIRRVRPDLYRGFNPWDRITDPDSLRLLLTDAGVTPAAWVDSAAQVNFAAVNSPAQAQSAVVTLEFAGQPLHSPEDWWSMVLGTGYRGTIEQLDADSREQVRQENLCFIRDSEVRSVETNVLYAVARRSAG